jgi:hypothetical protein
MWTCSYWKTDAALEVNVSCVWAEYFEKDNGTQKAEDE